MRSSFESIVTGTAHVTTDYTETRQTPESANALKNIVVVRAHTSAVEAAPVAAAAQVSSWGTSVAVATEESATSAKCVWSICPLSNSKSSRSSGSASAVSVINVITSSISFISIMSVVIVIIIINIDAIIIIIVMISYHQQRW